MQEKMIGRIIGNISNTYKIKTNKGIYEAYARGRFKNEEVTPLVGDIVEIEITDENSKGQTAIIEKIQPRKNEIKRPRMANIDQIIFIISTKNPKPDLLMLDKQLAYAEMKGIEPIIIINKLDLQDSYKTIQELYTKIGYKTIATSAKQGKGIDDLKQLLINKTSVFSGNSGVGKSSIINTLFGVNKTQEGEISKKNKKGKNTTTDTRLYELMENTYIADTPGFSTFDINEIEYRELYKYFKEVKEHTKDCEYLDCTHIKEEKCGVKLEVGKNISESRYNNYTKIYEELKDREEHKW